MLDKLETCFQHDLGYGYFIDLPRKTASDKLAFDIAKNVKYDRCQRELDSMVYKFFDKKSSGSAVTSAQSET